MGLQFFDREACSQKAFSSRVFPFLSFFFFLDGLEGVEFRVSGVFSLDFFLRRFPQSGVPRAGLSSLYFYYFLLLHFSYSLSV